MIHPSWFGRIEWFRKYRYSLLARRCEDHELLFRARAGSRYANLPDILVGYYEDRIDMRKMLASRYNWIRSLVGQRGGAALSEVAVGSIVTAAKVVVDGVGVMAGLVHRPLGHRAAPATDDELARWSEIWRSVAGVQEPRASSHSN
jgi:hypothetical protein